VYAILGEPNERQPSRDREDLWGYLHPRLRLHGVDETRNPVAQALKLVRNTLDSQVKVEDMVIMR
jgi:hypothetical protein